MKNLINISDLTLNDINQIYNYADILQNSNLDSKLKNKTIGLIFEKYSTRTRLSFQVGINQLSAFPLDIKLEDLNLQRSETFEDTFKMFNLYLDGLIYRTDDHNKLLLAKKFFNKPIINALSDLSHPCQILSDIFTLRKHFGQRPITISWFGDMNNVLYSYFEALNIFDDIKINIFTPLDVFNSKISTFPKSKNIDFFHDIDVNVIKKSDCLMTDVYHSMNDKFDSEKIKKLMKFQINSSIMKYVDQNCIFAHCLPANIGMEVTKDVIESPSSIVLNQAKNRMIVQKGILNWLYS